MVADWISAPFDGVGRITTTGVETTAQSIAAVPLWVSLPTVVVGVALTALYMRVSDPYPFIPAIQMPFVGTEDEDDDDGDDDESGGAS